MKSDERLKKIITLLQEETSQYIDEFKNLDDISQFAQIVANSHIDDSLFSDTTPLEKEFVEGLLRKIKQQAFSKAIPTKVAFLGPFGTFTHMALTEFFGDSVAQISMKTITDVFVEVESGNAEFGVVPIENSTEGAVTYTLDELIGTNLNIVAEKFLKVSFFLLSNETAMDTVQKVFSHPQSFGQCKHWLRDNLPNAEIIPCDSNSKAAKLAKETPFSAAIASEVAGDMYGLNSLAQSIEDLRHNFTRFFVVGHENSCTSGCDKTSIVCSIKDKPAALSELILPFGRNKINMTKIESRPNKQKAWEYNFYIDFQGHRDDKNVQKALNEIQEHTVFFKILGSYPIGHNN